MAVAWIDRSQLWTQDITVQWKLGEGDSFWLIIVNSKSIAHNFALPVLNLQSINDMMICKWGRIIMYLCSKRWENPSILSNSNCIEVIHPFKESWMLTYRIVRYDGEPRAPSSCIIINVIMRNDIRWKFDGFKLRQLYCVQGLTAERLTYVAFTFDEPGLDELLYQGYTFGQFKTSKMLRSMLLEWDIDKIHSPYFASPTLPSSMMSHLTKLHFSGPAVWVKDYTDAITGLQSLQKLRIRAMDFDTDILLQPFALLKRWAHTLLTVLNFLSTIPTL